MATKTFAIVLALVCASLVSLSQAYPVVPGSGRALRDVGDDFENPEWAYSFNLPKGSADIDKRGRAPYGRTKSGRWYEGSDRGQPDIVRRVPTPEDGLPGSEGALLIASKLTGIPGVANRERAQDDLFMGIDNIVGRYIPVSQTPNFVVRVYLPPLEEWEHRTGSSFGLRATVRGAKPDENKTEPYWPGMFFNLYTANRRRKNDEVYLVIRAGEPGSDYQSRKVTQMGWWTLGMSFSPDGKVHYYAKPGTEDLTDEDRLASHYPYGFRTRYLISVFFDVFSQNDGVRGSTPWIIDDPTVYVANPEMFVRKPVRKAGPKSASRGRTQRR